MQHGADDYQILNLETRVAVFIRLVPFVLDWRTAAQAVHDLGAFTAGDSFLSIVRRMNGSEVDLAAKRKRPPLFCWSWPAQPERCSVPEVVAWGR